MSAIRASIDEGWREVQNGVVDRNLFKMSSIQLFEAARVLKLYEFTVGLQVILDFLENGVAQICWKVRQRQGRLHRLLANEAVLKLWKYLWRSHE
jgi:hypothetical protein